MIAIQPKPLSDTEVSSLHKWLNQPEALLFRDYLTNLAAASVAQAGNALMESDNDVMFEDAKVLVVVAKAYRDTVTCLRKMSMKDYKFVQQLLNPPVNPITPV